MTYVIIVATEFNGAYGISDDDGMLVEFDDADEYIANNFEYGHYYYIIDLDTGEVDEI